MTKGEMLVSYEMMSSFSKVFKNEHGINVRTVMLLHHINSEKISHISEIIKWCSTFIDEKHMKHERMIILRCHKTLINKGLLLATEDQDDKRKNILSVTEKGKEILEIFHEEFEANYKIFIKWMKYLLP